MARDLTSVVRLVLREASEDDLEPQDPSFWREVGKTTSRFGSAAAGAAGTLGKAALDTLVGQAHAPGSEGDVQRAQASRVTLAFLLGGLAEYVVTLRFRIGAKMLDAARRGDLVAGAVGEEDARALLAGSLLHDMLEAGSFVPTVGYFSAVLDAVVYASEGDVDRAAECFVLAGIMGAAEGSALKASGMRDAPLLDVMRKSYGSVPFELSKTGGEVPLTAQEVSAVSSFVDSQAAALERANVQGASAIRSKAREMLRGRRPKFNRVLPDEARFLEANEAGRKLVNSGVEGNSLSVLRDSAEYIAELRGMARRRADDPLPMNRQLSYADIDPSELSRREYGDAPLPARPPSILPTVHGVGSGDLMAAWKKVASKYPSFWSRVKKVHWTGFTHKDFNSAAKATARFLDEGSTGVDLSTVGYTGDMVAGGRLGHDVFPIGIQVEGEVTLAVAGDAGTTNPASRSAGAKFAKQPQVAFERMRVGGEDVTIPRVARGPLNPTAQSPMGSQSKLMVGPTSWREPYSDGLNHNELIVGGQEGWRAKAIVVDPTHPGIKKGIAVVERQVTSEGGKRVVSSGVEQVFKLFDAAKRHNIPVIDPSGKVLVPSDLLKGVRENLSADIAKHQEIIAQSRARIRAIESGSDTNPVMSVDDHARNIRSSTDALGYFEEMLRDFSTEVQKYAQ